MRMPIHVFGINFNSSNDACTEPSGAKTNLSLEIAYSGIFLQVLYWLVPNSPGLIAFEDACVFGALGVQSSSIFSLRTLPLVTSETSN